MNIGKINMSGIDCLIGDNADPVKSKIWIDKLEKVGFPNYYSGTIKINYGDFCEILADNEEYIKLIDQLIHGKIILLKNTLSMNCVNNLRLKTLEYWKNNEDIFLKTLENCKNFHRIIDEKRTQLYSIKVIKHSTYIFPWNDDYTSHRDEINQVWKNLKIFQGLKPDAFEKNTPKDKIVDRIQICLYPPKVGYLQTHIDPTHNQLLFISGYLSKRGSYGSYSEGGFYAIDENNNKVDLEENIDEGDMSIGLATIRHGVNLIDPDYSGDVDWYGSKGRWFLGLYTNDSDEVANRRTTVKIGD